MKFKQKNFNKYKQYPHRIVQLHSLAAQLSDEFMIYLSALNIKVNIINTAQIQNSS